MEWLVGLLALTAMEIVLGIDNIIFIVILASRLPKSQQANARRFGLLAALVTRLMLLMAISWLTRLTAPVFYFESLGIPSGWLSEEANGLSWRDIILLAGGLFLIGKSVHEIHHKFEDHGKPETDVAKRISFTGVVVQIALVDIVFSLDSVITAVGMVNNVPVMIAAIMIAVGLMIFASNPLGNFIDKHPTVKMLALAFLILVGMALVADGLDYHIPRAYLYFAMAFSGGVEALNLVARRRHERKRGG